MKRQTITLWCQNRICQMVREPALCIDATAGTGRDTLFLRRIVAEGGRVAAMDVQEEALRQTGERLEKAGYRDVELLLDGHQNMDRYFDAGTADLIMFNLGYLPGGDHSLSTKAETTLTALEKSLDILKEGGILSLMIYSGGDTGFAEKEAVLSWLRELDCKKYLVLVEQFYNRPGNPPLPVFVYKLV